MKTIKDGDLATTEEDLSSDVSSNKRGMINTETIAAAGRPQFQEAERYRTTVEVNPNWRRFLAIKRSENYAPIGKKFKQDS
jgi:hypothetical protein